MGCDGLKSVAPKHSESSPAILGGNGFTFGNQWKSVAMSSAAVVRDLSVALPPAVTNGFIKVALRQENPSEINGDSVSTQKRRSGSMNSVPRDWPIADAPDVSIEFTLPATMAPPTVSELSGVHPNSSVTTLGSASVKPVPAETPVVMTSTPRLTSSQAPVPTAPAPLSLPQKAPVMVPMAPLPAVLALPPIDLNSTATRHTPYVMGCGLDLDWNERGRQNQHYSQPVGSKVSAGIPSHDFIPNKVEVRGQPRVTTGYSNERLPRKTTVDDPRLLRMKQKFEMDKKGSLNSCGNKPVIPRIPVGIPLNGEVAKMKNLYPVSDSIDAQPSTEKRTQASSNKILKSQVIEKMNSENGQTKQDILAAKLNGSVIRASKPSALLTVGRETYLDRVLPLLGIDVQPRSKGAQKFEGYIPKSRNSREVNGVNNALTQPPNGHLALNVGGSRSRKSKVCFSENDLQNISPQNLQEVLSCRATLQKDVTPVKNGILIKPSAVAGTDAVNGSGSELKKHGDKLLDEFELTTGICLDEMIADTGHPTEVDPDFDYILENCLTFEPVLPADSDISAALENSGDTALDAASVHYLNGYSGQVQHLVSAVNGCSVCPSVGTDGHSGQTLKLISAEDGRLLGGGGDDAKFCYPDYFKTSDSINHSIYSSAADTCNNGSYLTQIPTNGYSVDSNGYPALDIPYFGQLDSDLTNAELGGTQMLDFSGWLDGVV